uniref:Uncharacterized protein n=1 Tax=Setaria viridis TaxID=4556 RepID=A0A4U6VAE7_SETVI|nr:hypothetical protein SEVIR_3G024350v2 [Setaria viridis]
MLVLCSNTFCCCLLITMLVCGVPVSEILNVAPVCNFVQHPQQAKQLGCIFYARMVGTG